MANQGFRGDCVHIHELRITAGASANPPLLSCEVQFASEDGVVHGVSKHHFALDAEHGNDDGLTQAAQALLSLVVKRVELLHFRQPSDSGSELLRGIAETLRSQADSDEPGTQG